MVARPRLNSASILPTTRATPTVKRACAIAQRAKLGLLDQDPIWQWLTTAVFNVIYVTRDRIGR